LRAKGQGYILPAAVPVSIPFPGNITGVVKETGRGAGNANVYFAEQLGFF